MNRKLSLSLAIALSVTAMVGCSKHRSSNAAETVQNAPEHAVENVALQVVAVDAKTGLPINGASVAFSGDLAANVTTTAGVAASSASLASGVESFYVKNGKTGELVLKIQASGYLASSKAVSVIKGENTVSIELIALTSDVEGVDIVTGSVTTGSDGVVTAAQSFGADVGATDNAINLSIGQGVALKDAAGNPVSGALEVTMATFTPSEPTAMQAVTSDLVVTNAAGQEAVSVVAAFIDLSIATASGTEVKTLVPAATVSVTLDPQVKDPTTGEAFVVGDKLAVWSNSNGVVKYEGEAVVKAGGIVDLSISHLSSYWISKDVTTCGDNAPKLVIPSGKGVSLALSILAKNGGFSHSRYSEGADTIVLGKFPSSSPDLSFEAAFGSEVVGSQLSAKVGCGAVITLPISLPSYSKVTAKVSERCKQDTKVSTPMASAPVTVLSASGLFVAGGKTDSLGVKEFTLVEGKGYNVIAKSRTSGVSDTTSLTLKGNQVVEFPFDVECAELTGAQ